MEDLERPPSRNLPPPPLRGDPPPWTPPPPAADSDMTEEDWREIDRERTQRILRHLYIAPAHPEERDQLVNLRLLLQPAPDIPRPRASDQLTLRIS